MFYHIEFLHVFFVYFSLICLIITTFYLLKYCYYNIKIKQNNKFNDYDNNPDWVHHSLNSHMIHHPALDPNDPDGRNKRRRRIKYKMAKILFVGICIIVPIAILVIYNYPPGYTPELPPKIKYRTTWYDLPLHLPTVDQINPRPHHVTKHKWYNTLMSTDLFKPKVLRKLEFWELTQINEWLEDLNIQDDQRRLIEVFKREARKLRRAEKPIPLYSKNNKEVLLFIKKCINIYKESKKRKK